MNPDFRTVGKVEVTSDLRNLLGWTDHRARSERDLIDAEKRSFGEIEAETPAVFQTQIPREFNSSMLEKWNAFQMSKGRYAGSADWSLMDEFFGGHAEGDSWAGGSPLLWLPQIIGSCVCSNTFRGYVIRQMIQIILFGDAQEYLGRNEFGSRNFAFYCPYTYGLARRKANMRRGDGLYCAPMAWALMQGVLPCNTPKLLEILQSNGVAGERDFPEPQGRDGAAFYRRMGNWAFLDELKPYADYAVQELPEVKNADQLWDLQQAGKPTFVCSMEAIHQAGQHPDGFPIHKRDPRDRWAHNMGCHGCFVASDGERFFRWSNESWGAKHIYTRRYDEVEASFRSGRLTMRAIGQVNGPSSAPPSLAV